MLPVLLTLISTLLIWTRDSLIYLYVHFVNGSEIGVEIKF